LGPFDGEDVGRIKLDEFSRRSGDEGGDGRMRPTELDQQS
jgi:hypothetical protein